MIRRLFLLLAGIIAITVGVFVAVCLTAFLLLRRIYLSIRNAMFGEPARATQQRRAEPGVIDGSYTEVVTPEEPVEIRRIE